MCKYVIRKSDNEPLKIDNKILFFNSATDAYTYINMRCGGSMYLSPGKWLK